MTMRLSSTEPNQHAFCNFFQANQKKCPEFYSIVREGYMAYFVSRILDKYKQSQSDIRSECTARYRLVHPSVLNPQEEYDQPCYVALKDFIRLQAAENQDPSNQKYSVHNLTVCDDRNMFRQSCKTYHGAHTLEEASEILQYRR